MFILTDKTSLVVESKPYFPLPGCCSIFYWNSCVFRRISFVGQGFPAHTVHDKLTGEKLSGGLQHLIMQDNDIIMLQVDILCLGTYLRKFNYKSNAKQVILMKLSTKKLLKDDLISKILVLI